MLAPIALFVYNRPEHTRHTVEALKRNALASESVLHIFADGAKPSTSEEGLQRIAEVRGIVRQINGFKEVILHLSEQNNGCAKSIINGVTSIVQQYGRVIVVEDDIETIPQFLSFMNKALDEADLDGVAGGNILEPFKTSKDCRFSNACERTINCFDGPVLLRDGENVETEVCDEPSPIEPMNPKDWKTGCVGDFRH